MTSLCLCDCLSVCLSDDDGVYQQRKRSKRFLATTWMADVGGLGGWPYRAVDAEEAMASFRELLLVAVDVVDVVVVVVVVEEERLVSEGYLSYSG